MSAVAILLVALVVPACQVARAGTRCNTKDFGQDQTHILQCRKGRWIRVMTKVDYANLLKKILDSQTTTTTTTTTAAPATTAPPSTSTTTSTTPPATTGSVTGNLTYTGAPPSSGFPARVTACPGNVTVSTTTAGSAVVDGSLQCVRTLAVSGAYTLSLPVGAWSIAATAEPVYDMFTYGSTTQLTVTGSAPEVRNLSVPWVDSGTLTGSIQITGAPSGTYWPDVTITACPGTTITLPTTPSNGCPNRTSTGEEGGGLVSSSPTLPYGQLTAFDLLEGTWTIQAHFAVNPLQAGGGGRSASAPVTLQIVGGQPITQNITLQWPAFATVTGSVTYTAVPSGQSNSTATLTYACPGSVTATPGCAGGASLFNPFASSYTLMLDPGTWSLASGRASIVANLPVLSAALGASVAVTVADGATISQPLAAPWGA